MALRALTYLKNRFLTGAKPAQDDYHDLMDSFVHKNDVEAINAAVVNEQITAYDAELKAVGTGALTTLGDVLQVLSGFTTLANIKTMIEEASGSVSWATIQNKPQGFNVTWDEYTQTTDTYLTATPTTIESVGSTRIVRDIGGATKFPANQKVVISDIIITTVQVKWEGTSFPSYPVTRIRGVVVGLNPRITLS